MYRASGSRAELELSRRALMRLAAGGAATATFAATSARIPTVASALASQGDPGGQITLAWGRSPLTFNPIDPVGGIERTVWQLTTSRLVNKDVEGNIIPDFAERYEVDSEGRQYTFHLVKNATWSDGAPVTATDVAFTYTLAADSRTGSLGFTPATSMSVVEGVDRYLSGETESISGINMLDDYTIQFNLAEPDASFLSFIAGYYGPYLVPSHLLGSIPPDQFDQSDYNANPEGRVGMGPYILSEARQDQHVVFTRNDTYFKGPPLIDTFIYRVMQPDVALAALLTGEVDVAGIPASELPIIAEHEDINIVTYPTNLWNGLMFNQTVDDLADPRIAQAVLHALDRETYAEQILSGLGEPWDSIIVQEQWVSPNIVHYEYNPEKARELLTAANWDSDRVVEWRYYNPFFRGLAPVLQQSLAAVGFNINPVELETATWVEAYQAGDFEFSVVGGGGITDDPSELESYFQCDVWSRYCNQQVLDLFAQGHREVEESERKAIYNEIQEIINRDLPWFPLFSTTAAFGFTERVQLAAYSAYDYVYYEDWSLTE